MLRCGVLFNCMYKTEEAFSLQGWKWKMLNQCLSNDQHTTNKLCKVLISNQFWTIKLFSRIQFEATPSKNGIGMDCLSWLVEPKNSINKQILGGLPNQRKNSDAYDPAKMVPTTKIKFKNNHIKWRIQFPVIDAK